jgi:hypothetical protein
MSKQINLVTLLPQSYSGQEDLYCVYVPTNHLYIGDVFMVNSKDVIRPNLSVREGIGNSSLQCDSIYHFIFCLNKRRWILDIYLGQKTIDKKRAYMYFWQRLLYPVVCQCLKFYQPLTHK